MWGFYPVPNTYFFPDKLSNISKNPICCLITYNEKRCEKYKEPSSFWCLAEEEWEMKETCPASKSKSYKIN